RNPSGGGTADPIAIRTELEQTRAELAGVIVKMNNLFLIISANMTPSAQLFTLPGPPTTTTLHAVAAVRLALYGFIVVFLAVPLIIVGCLIHHRLKEEEAEERYGERTRAV